jgi:hypothetical protein
LPLIFGGDPNPMLEHFAKVHIGAIPQPLANGLFPRIDRETLFLLGGRECLELWCLKPPGRARLES